MIGIPKSPYVLGIDLGTTNSSAAVYSRGEAISLKLDETGRITIPSCVWFPDKKITETRVGLEAKQKILINPNEVFSSFKPLMKNNDWKKEEDYKSLVEKFEQIEEMDLTPTDIAIQVLKAIINAVLNQSDFELEGEIQEAIICVPANTTDQYRKNVYQAALEAGLGIKDEEGEVILNDDRPEGVRILEEPTAAAFAHGLDMGFLEEGADKEQTILVYDLGGGTFDATILHIDATSTNNIPEFSVKTTRGVAQLGGDDFDRIIMEMVAEEFQEESGLDIFDLKSDQNATLPRMFMTAQQKLKEVAETAKIEMANGSKESEIIIPEFLKDGDGNKYSLEHTIKKSDFLARVEPLLEKANECVENALKDAKLSIEDINRIILVGGSTKASWVKEAVERLGKVPYEAKNVDVIVSRGAAFYGASVPLNKQDDDDIILKRTTSHNLGIEIEGAEFSLLVEKDLPIGEGIVKTNTYYNQEQQDTVNITIYKTQHAEVTGEKEEKTLARKHYINEKMDDAKIFDCIGDFRLTGIPKAPKGEEAIEVTFSIGEDDTLSVTAKIVSTGDTADINITL